MSSNRAKSVGMEMTGYECKTFVFQIFRHGQKISSASKTPRAHLLGMRQILLGEFAAVWKRLRPYPAPCRNARRRLVQMGRLGNRPGCRIDVAGNLRALESGNDRVFIAPATPEQLGLPLRYAFGSHSFSLHAFGHITHHRHRTDNCSCRIDDQGKTHFDIKPGT